MKQVLVGQEMYQEQENSHLKYPDHVTLFLHLQSGSIKLSHSSKSVSKFNITPNITHKRKSKTDFLMNMNS